MRRMRGEGLGARGLMEKRASAPAVPPCDYWCNPYVR